MGDPLSEYKITLDFSYRVSIKICVRFQKQAQGHLNSSRDIKIKIPEQRLE